MTPLLARVPKVAHGLVASLVWSIFDQMDAKQVRKQHGVIVEQLRTRFSKAAELLDEAAHGILAFTAFPGAAWRQIRPQNPQERLNKEVRRRTDVTGIFPNRAAIIPLVRALLCKQHEEWWVTRRYMSLGTIGVVRALGTNDSNTSLPGQETALESRTESA